MQALRTILLLALTIVLVAFIAINWVTVPVNFWPLADGNYLHFEWPVGFIVLLAFLAGLLPMWLLSRASKWHANRRIATLQNTVAAASVSAPVAVATSTQLEAEAAPPPAQEPTI
jgi:lipopolysaccharide assembly protein A